MMVGQVVPLADVDRNSFLRFRQGGLRCFVVDTWGSYHGLVAQDDGFARVVADGWSRDMVASATAALAGPAVDPDLQAPATRRAAAVAPLDPDWDLLAVDEEPDFEVVSNPCEEPTFAPAAFA